MRRFMATALAGCVCFCLAVMIQPAPAVAGGGEECVGDVDGDGQTGIHDFLEVLYAFGQDCSDTPCDEDVDGDGMVGVHDFIAVFMDFGCGAPGCTNKADCDDGDDCTFDLCIQGTCLNIPICGP